MVLVESSGRRLRISTRTAYDLATLKRILGMGSATSCAKMGRTDFAMTGRESAGARICDFG